jgi:hypothetical protein
MAEAAEVLRLPESYSLLLQPRRENYHILPYKGTVIDIGTIVYCLSKKMPEVPQCPRRPLPGSSMNRGFSLTP